MSYAIVAYRTAYMKRHYPREYMAALLTSVLENSAKIAEYIAECREMGIRLLPPDVNESDANFTVAGEHIRFGLVAIKGIGWGAIHDLVAERARGGLFRSFEDFCRRMAGKDLNRRVTESLIRAGAFDSMGYRRRALVQIAGAVIDSVNRAQKENISGQFDLFGDEGGEGESDSVSVPIPDVEEFTAREKMAMEKEATGLYLSGHPMDEYRERVRAIGAVPIGALMADFAQNDSPHRFADGQVVTVAGVISSARTRTTKNNSLMSYVVLEDDTGSMELIVFQKTLDTCGAYIRENETVIARGRISVRDEKEPQLMCDSVRPITDVTAAAAKEKTEQKLYVRLPSRDDARMRHLELVLKMFPGSGQMVIWCEAEKKRIGAKCLFHEALLDELKETMGEENVVLK